MNRGYLITIIFVILAAKHTICDPCTITDCSNSCATNKQYDRVACDAKDHYCECSSAGKGNPIPCFEGYNFDQPTESCIWPNSASSSASGSNDDYKLNFSNCDGMPNDQKIIGSAEPCKKYATCTNQVAGGDVDCANANDRFNPMIGACVSKDTYVCEDTQLERLPDCGPSVGLSKFYSDKEDCAGYYYCIDGVRVKGKCDAQKYDFDPIGQRCAYKSGKCKPVLTSKSSDSASKDFHWETICKGKSGQFLTDPRVCNAYILCMSDTKPRQAFCKTDTYFSNGSCSKTPPKTCNCELLPDHTGYAPHVDKNKFYVCSETGPEEKTCPQGTIWNEKAASCVMS